MAAPYTAPTMHILLLEDDRTLAAAVLAYLHTKHYQVDWADSLAQARPLIGVNHYWAVLLDLNLPMATASRCCRNCALPPTAPP